MLRELRDGRLAGLTVGDGTVAVFSIRGQQRLLKLFQRLEIPVLESLDDAQAFDDVMIVHADYVFEERVLQDLAGFHNAALSIEGENGEQRIVAVICPAARAAHYSNLVEQGLLENNQSDEGISILSLDDISGHFNQRLRKRGQAIVRKVTPESIRSIERLLFKGSYKGATDFVTKFVLPEPALVVTRIAAALRLTPNSVTFVSLLLVLATTFLFLKGHFIAGVITGWLMCFLDTVDGKLARVTLQSSKFGNVFDHGIDLIHPPFWYAAWASGVVATTANPDAAMVSSLLWIINGGYVIGRLVEGYFTRRHKIEIHIWRPIDYWFRHITARRNPNLVMLTIVAIAGAPMIGLYAIAIWTVVSLIFHFFRTIAAERFAHAEKMATPLRSWLAE